MYQVRTYNRQTNEAIMVSDTFDFISEADEAVISIGQGEGYYSTIFKLEPIASDWDSIMARHQPKVVAKRT